MKKALIIIVGVIVLVSAGTVLARNVIAKHAIEKTVHNLLGQKLTIEKINLGILGTNVSVKSMKIYNPAGYHEKFLAEIPELFINYAPWDIMRGYLHFPELRLDISELNVEKDSSGAVNLERFKPEETAKKQEKKPGKEKKFLIDSLTLSIGTIRYRDSSKTPVSEKVLQINYRNTFQNISSAETIVQLVMAEAVKGLLADGIKFVMEDMVTKGKIAELIGTGDPKEGAPIKDIKDRFKKLF